MIVRAALAAIAVTACTPPPREHLAAADLLALDEMIGTWAWQHRETVDGVERDERERWTIDRGADWTALGGHYQRTVAFTATDGVPFTCAQAPRYQLASTIQLAIHATPGGAIVDELAYQAAPSPCDRGLRRRTSYLATAHGDTLELRWDDGVAHLTRVPPDAPPPPAPLAIAAAPAGPWTWSATSWTTAGLAQREDEAWQLTLGDDGALAGWYLRTVTIRDPAGAIIPCAGAAEYRYVDRYLLRGRHQPAEGDDGGDGWRFDEVAVDAGTHPCLAAHPVRSRDGATVEVVGDALVLTWRGARRQVLHRPAG